MSRDVQTEGSSIQIDLQTPQTRGIMGLWAKGKTKKAIVQSDTRRSPKENAEAESG
jgi:hypothetical protein